MTELLHLLLPLNAQMERQGDIAMSTIFLLRSAIWAGRAAACDLSSSLKRKHIRVGKVSLQVIGSFTDPLSS